jgi:hypothetical protein
MRQRKNGTYCILMMLLGLCYTYHSSGQHAELADLGGPVVRGTMSTTAPISDDGQERAIRP